ncbi:HAD family hydrolase [Vreelandella massiliensis]|uniref:HAD family hydrolase n=1 Tax=Vreelandella massiliensis TaxID=1816686 RepID=UPI00096A6229|nr:HAD family hydrolase [Halomonas massiliensis]
MQRLTLFDLDDTLLDGDCSEQWNWKMIDLGWIDNSEQFLAATQNMQEAYHAGKLKLETYLETTLEPLKGRYVDDVAACATDFVARHVMPRMFAQARETIEAHRVEGDTLVIISASSKHLVGPIAAALGVPHVIAVEPTVLEGRYTGATTGVLSYRSGKVTRFQQWKEQQGLGMLYTTFYSDSRNDVPLLNAVNKPVAVNPDPVLAEIAEKEGWQRLDWRENADQKQALYASSIKS